MENSDEDKNIFYTDAAKYWENIPATVDGMLGGFGFISRVDIEGSDQFLKALFRLKNPPHNGWALDCGSGIGRITKYLLSKHFEHVDLVEQNKIFLDKAREFLSNCSSKIGNFYSMGLQDFSPERKYDVIWCQWVLGHLQDNDLIVFLEKCRDALTTNGILVIKENVTSSDEVEIDRQDSSVTRPYKDLQGAFETAGLACIKERKQANLPSGLYPVYTFALKPPDK